MTSLTPNAERIYQSLRKNYKPLTIDQLIQSRPTDIRFSQHLRDYVRALQRLLALVEGEEKRQAKKCLPS